MLAGDSWGRGEWDPTCSVILHSGLEKYLKESGHIVLNICIGGISNQDIVNRISNYLQRSSRLLPELILVFQTEYTRDFKHNKMQTDFFDSQDWTNLTNIQDLQNCWVERFYLQLCKIATMFSIPIKIIGGCSDTKFFDNMENDYPGCDIVCQSFTNLILNGQHTILNPVFSWYTQSAKNLIQKLYKVLPPASIDDLLNEMDRGFERECSLAENPDFFYPDGKHPNRIGHQILFDFLMSKKILD
jgi:hypothetical protein